MVGDSVSIAIVAITSKAILIATDSRERSKDGTIVDECAPKIYRHKNGAVFFGVGDAGIVKGFFEMLHNKKPRKLLMSVSSASKEIMFWKQSVENEENLEGKCASIGTFVPSPETIESRVIHIWSGFDEDCIDYLDAGTLYVLPPPNLSYKECQDVFISHCPDNSSPPQLSELILAARQTIEELSLRSDHINNRVQYVGYDLEQGQLLSSNLVYKSHYL